MSVISNCKRDFEKWTPKEIEQVRNEYLRGETFDTIGRKYERHAKSVCKKLLDEGFIDSDEDISKRHTRFCRLKKREPTKYNLRKSKETIVYKSDSDSDSDNEKTLVVETRAEQRAALLEKLAKDYEDTQKEGCLMCSS